MTKLYHNWKYVISRTISGLQQLLASLRKPTENVVNSATVANPETDITNISVHAIDAIQCLF